MVREDAGDVSVVINLDNLRHWLMLFLSLTLLHVPESVVTGGCRDRGVYVGLSGCGNHCVMTDDVMSYCIIRYGVINYHCKGSLAVEPWVLSDDTGSVSGVIGKCATSITSRSMTVM